MNNINSYNSLEIENLKNISFILKEIKNSFDLAISEEKDVILFEEEQKKIQEFCNITYGEMNNIFFFLLRKKIIRDIEFFHNPDDLSDNPIILEFPEDFNEKYIVNMSEINKSYNLKNNQNNKEKEEDNKKDDRKRKEIIIDFQKGIYEKDNIKKIYEISGKRFEIVEQLFKRRKNNTPLKELIANTGQGGAVIIKEIGNTNKVFKKKLNLKEDLIVNLKTGGGYRLNDEDFIIKK